MHAKECIHCVHCGSSVRVWHTSPDTRLWSAFHHFVSHHTCPLSPGCLFKGLHLKARPIGLVFFCFFLPSRRFLLELYYCPCPHTPFHRHALGFSSQVFLFKLLDYVFSPSWVFWVGLWTVYVWFVFSPCECLLFTPFVNSICSGCPKTSHHWKQEVGAHFTSLGFSTLASVRFRIEFKIHFVTY